MATLHILIHSFEQNEDVHFTYEGAQSGQPILSNDENLSYLFM